MSEKKYDGYRSYSYLVKGEDYSEIPLAMENPGEAMRNAVCWLVKHGYSDTDVAKIAGGNALRVLKETWAR